MIRRYLLSHLQYYHRLKVLNYCVRDGNRCDHFNMFAGRDCSGLFARCNLILGSVFGCDLLIKKAINWWLCRGSKECDPFRDLRPVEKPTGNYLRVVSQTHDAPKKRRQTMREHRLIMTNKSYLKNERTGYMWSSFRPLVQFSWTHYWAYTYCLSTW